MAKVVEKNFTKSVLFKLENLQDSDDVVFIAIDKLMKAINQCGIPISNRAKDKLVEEFGSKLDNELLSNLKIVLDKPTIEIHESKKEVKKLKPHQYKNKIVKKYVYKEDDCFSLHFQKTIKSSRELLKGDDFQATLENL